MSLFWCYGKNPGLYVVCNWWWIHSTRASPLVHQIAATITSLRVFHLHFQFSNFVDFDFFVPHSTLRVFYVKFSKWIDCTEYFCMVITEISFSRNPPPLSFFPLVSKFLIVFVPFRRSSTWPRQTCSLLPPQHSCRSYRRTWCPSRTTHRHSYRQSSIVSTARTQVTQTLGVPSLPALG